MKFPLSKNSFLRKGASALKITDIQAGDISISLLHPFKTALRTVDAVNDVVVRKDYIEQENPVGTSADNPIEYTEGTPLINNAFYRKDIGRRALEA